MLWRPVLAASILLSMTGGADATGGLSCDAEDRSMSFGAEFTVSRSLSSRLVGFEAQLEVRLDHAPDDMKLLRFDEADLVHHWLHDRDIKLKFLREREREPYGYVELVIDIGNERAGRGAYHLRIHSDEDGPSKALDLEARGSARCEFN